MNKGIEVTLPQEVFTGGDKIDYETIGKVQELVADRVVKDGGRGLLQFDTQVGKSRTTAIICKQLDKKSCVVAPKNLHKQWIETFEEFEYTNYELVSSQWLARKGNKLPNAELYVCDEIQESKVFREKVYKRKKPMLLLSATPERNDYRNWWYIAKAVYPEIDFIGKDDLRLWMNHWLVADPQKQWIKTYYPSCYPDRWKSKDFTELLPIMRIKRDLGHVQEYKAKLKRKVKFKGYLECNNAVFFPSSSLDREIHLDLASICEYNYDGETKEIIKLHKELDEWFSLIRDRDKSCLVICKTPALVEYIGKTYDMSIITGSVPMEDRPDIYDNSKRIVATATCVGVGISALHHLENIVCLEKQTDKTLLIQIKGRVINSKNPTFTEII